MLYLWSNKGWKQQYCP